MKQPLSDDPMNALLQLAEIRLQESTRQEMAKEEAEAEVERLRAALEKLVSYARQLELVAYPPDDVEHPVIKEARAALRGGEKGKP
jgi:hypothetical protein